MPNLICISGLSLGCHPPPPQLPWNLREEGTEAQLVPKRDGVGADCPPKPHAPSLTPGPQAMAAFGDVVFAVVIRVKTRSLG